MKNVGKKIFACCGAFLMVTAMSITVFATTLTGSSLGHKMINGSMVYTIVC